MREEDFCSLKMLKTMCTICISLVWKPIFKVVRCVWQFAYVLNCCLFYVTKKNKNKNFRVFFLVFRKMFSLDTQKNCLRSVFSMHVSARWCQRYKFMYYFGSLTMSLPFLFSTVLLCFAVFLLSGFALTFNMHHMALVRLITMAFN